MKIGKCKSFIRDSVDVFRFVGSISKTFCIVSIIRGIGEGCIQIFIIVYSAYIIDMFIQQKSYSEIYNKCIGFVLIVFIFSFLFLLMEKYMDIKKRYIEDYTKIRIAEKSMKMSYSVIEKQTTMQMLEKARRGIYANGGITTLFSDFMVLTKSLFQIFYSIVCMMGLFVKVETDKTGIVVNLFNSAWVLLLVCIFVFTSVLVSAKNTSDLSVVKNKTFEDCVESNRKFGYFFSFLFKYQFGKDIRIYGMQKMIQDELSKCNQDILKIEKEGVRKISYVTNTNIIIDGLFETFIYMLVGIKAVLGLITVGSVVKYVGLIKLVIVSINKILEVTIMAKLRLKYIHYYCDFVCLPSEKDFCCKNERVETNTSTHSVIEFRNVSFKYANNNNMTLKDINLTIKKNEKIAVVGKNGAGKTTLVKLLCNLYQPTYGDILYNGIGIKEYSQGVYEKEIAVLFQDFKLFSFTVGENIACSNNVDDKFALECVRFAKVEDMIVNLEEGLNTYLYNDIVDGIEISGGEAQKIAFARALYKKANVLVLDEPTSALDPVTEADFYEMIRNNVRDKVVIYISHRMSSCKFCDRIIVLDEGRIHEIGNHHELMNKRGLYYELWNSQANNYV